MVLCRTPFINKKYEIVCKEVKRNIYMNFVLKIGKLSIFSEGLRELMKFGNLIKADIKESNIE